MAVNVTWDNADQCCVKYVFEGKWDWNDLCEAYKEARMLERSVGRRVDVVLEMEQDAVPHAALPDCHFVTNNAFIYRLIQQYRPAAIQ